METPDLTNALRVVLAAAPSEVVAVYLYGSRARATARADSDLDLALLLSAPPPATLHNVAREVKDAVERAVRIPVEAVVLNGAPADLAHRVLRDGILVLDRDRAARLWFEVRARNEYFDLAPLRRLYRRVPA